MKFEVRLVRTETYSAVVEIDAASEREAEDKAEDLLDRGLVVWGPEDDTTEEVFSVDRA